MVSNEVETVSVDSDTWMRIEGEGGGLTRLRGRNLKFCMDFGKGTDRKGE